MFRFSGSEKCVILIATAVSLHLSGRQWKACEQAGSWLFLPRQQLPDVSHPPKKGKRNLQNETNKTFLQTFKVAPCSFSTLKFEFWNHSNVTVTCNLLLCSFWFPASHVTSTFLPDTSCSSQTLLSLITLSVNIFFFCSSVDFAVHERRDLLYISELLYAAAGGNPRAKNPNIMRCCFKICPY